MEGGGKRKRPDGVKRGGYANKGGRKRRGRERPVEEVEERGELHTGGVCGGWGGTNKKKERGLGRKGRWEERLGQI